ncbi:MAG TPA: C69 family dipeptidase [Clostridia bacterium]|nr:C69 family dipeptidase [Clostridia bacterium]
MCDTMVALGNSTRDGVTIFAKNSDRQPNEPHIMIRVPAADHEENSKVKCTYIEVDQVPHTYEILLLKPSWLWGCEMGCNEFGLNIGNEAVFTKEPYGEDALTGMDMIRLALERCKTAKEALMLIIGLLEEYGQGGNCGYEKDFTYHNSFLIADSDSAWVLETAGIYWVAEKVKDVRSISNCLSIGSEFDLHHPDLIKNAVDKGWCKSEDDFNFAKCYTEPIVTHFSGSKARLATSTSILKQNKGQITVDTMKNILRSHVGRVDANPFKKSSLKSVCMHGGFIFGDHATGSYVASIQDGLPTYWITGSSTPCISLFKPYWMLDEEEFLFEEDEEDKALEYWHVREEFHRMVIENRIQDLDRYIKKRDEIERDLSHMVGALDMENPNTGVLRDIMDKAFREEEELILDFLARNRDNPVRIKGNPYFRRYWRKQNEKLRTQTPMT